MLPAPVLVSATAPEIKPAKLTGDGLFKVSTAELPELVMVPVVTPPLSFKLATV